MQILPAEETPRVSESNLPEGFLEPTQIEAVFERQQPAYRAVEGQSFWACFQHIQRHGIPMTAPVVMTTEESQQGAGLGRMTAMRFFYPHPADAPAKVPESERAEVVDVPAGTYLVIAFWGRPTAATSPARLEQLRQAAVARGYRVTGPAEVLGYNSPRVPNDQQLWELQLPVVSETQE
jgi:hypothetical protein